jgi:hypothetical protein
MEQPTKRITPMQRIAHEFFITGRTLQQIGTRTGRGKAAVSRLLARYRATVRESGGRKAFGSDVTFQTDF